MQRMKLIMLGLLAVFAVSAVASESASAHRYFREKCVERAEGQGTKFLTEKECIEQPAKPIPGKWEHETIGIANIEGTSGVSKLESVIAKETVTIECLKDVFTGTLEPGGKSKGEVKFTECKVFNKLHEELVACKVKEPIEFQFTDQLVGIAGRPEDEFKPTKAEETFVEITIENVTGKNCLEKVTNLKVKGTQTCELPNAGALLVTHEIVCTPSGGKLKLGTEEAKFTSTEKVNLSGTAGKWGAD